MADLQLNTFHHRAFIGIHMPKEVHVATRKFVRSLGGEARNFRFVNYEQLHLTLQFLGSTVSTESLNIIIDKLISIKPNLTPFEITLSNVSFGYPGQRNPSAIAWEVYSSEFLSSLTREIHDSIKKLGLEDVVRLKDRTRNFKRVIIARTKHSTSKSFGRKTNDKLKTIEVAPITFKVDEISLVKSTVHKSTPIYTDLFKLTL